MISLLRERTCFVYVLPKAKLLQRWLIILLITGICVFYVCSATGNIKIVIKAKLYDDISQLVEGVMS